MAELEPTDEALVEELVRAAYTAAANAIGLGALDFSALSPTGKAQWYASIRAILPILQRELAKAKADAERLAGAGKLALEYWAHRQQRYKNRHPVWVQEMNAALATYQEKI